MTRIGRKVIITGIIALALAACGGSSDPASPKSAAPASPKSAVPTSYTDANGFACAHANSDGYCPVDPAASKSPVSNVPASAAPAAPSAPASQPATAPAPASSAPAQQAPASQPATAPAGPTVSQQQALESAQSYLDLGSGFSRAGLIAQLDSPYGGKFSVADATWAADHSGADWNAQAVLAAKGYMQLGGFSRASLIDQLDSPYGGRFTLAQATYAADQVGL